MIIILTGFFGFVSFISIIANIRYERQTNDLIKKNSKLQLELETEISKNLKELTAPTRVL